MKTVAEPEYRRQMETRSDTRTRGELGVPQNVYQLNGEEGLLPTRFACPAPLFLFSLSSI